MTAIHDMTAAEILAAYKSKKLSPVEVTDAIVERIETWELKLKALDASTAGDLKKELELQQKILVSNPAKLFEFDS
jgi:aspartyl-tRNA(Asn)/glutamyl-tRNA(Gln) amidotransferase subunit A